MRSTSIKHYVEMDTGSEGMITLHCNCGWLREVSNTVPLIDVIKIVRQHKKPYLVAVS